MKYILIQIIIILSISSNTFSQGQIDALVSSALEKYQRGNLIGALNDFNNAIDLSPDNADIYVYRGNIYNKMREYTKAIRDYDRAIEINPNFTEAYHDRGFSKFHLGDESGALEDISRAIELNPSKEKTYFDRAIILYEIEEYEKALNDLNKAIEINPSFSAGYGLRGNVKESFGDITGACTDWRKSATLGNFELYNWIRMRCN